MSTYELDGVKYSKLTGKPLKVNANVIPLIAPESYLNTAPSECEPNAYSDTAQAMLDVPEIRLSPAAKILKTAQTLIDGDRDIQHGDRLECHSTIAALWGVYLGKSLEPKDVAAMMVLLKIARIKTGGHNPDCWVDAAGYAALGGELANPD